MPLPLEITEPAAKMGASRLERCVVLDTLFDVRVCA